jgi:hypothetical protein
MIDRKKVAAIGATLGMVSLPSLAALDTTVTTAVAGAQADMLEMGALIVAAAVAALGVRWVLRFAK